MSKNRTYGFRTFDNREGKIWLDKKTGKFVAKVWGRPAVVGRSLLKVLDTLRAMGGKVSPGYVAELHSDLASHQGPQSINPEVLELSAKARRLGYRLVPMGSM